jgi:transcriptional regulator with XRE-family HTH domain
VLHDFFKYFFALLLRVAKDGAIMLREGGEHMAVFNDRMKLRRLELGLTLLDVANRVGVKEATVQRYESGEIRNVKHDMIVSLAEALQCTPSFLMGWENSSTNRAAQTINDDDEAFALRDMLRKRPEMKALFDMSRKATKEDVQTAIKIIDALTSRRDD